MVFQSLHVFLLVAFHFVVALTANNSRLGHSMSLRSLHDHVVQVDDSSLLFLLLKKKPADTDATVSLWTRVRQAIFLFLKKTNKNTTINWVRKAKRNNAKGAWSQRVFTWIMTERTLDVVFVLKVMHVPLQRTFNSCSYVARGGRRPKFVNWLLSRT